MKLTFIEKISFGFGGGVNAVKTDFFVWYLGVYYLTVVGLNPLYTGTALLIALIFDAFSDPLIGAFSDRIKSKFGRRHSLMLLSLAPITLSYYLLFIPPDLILDHQFNAFLWLTIFSIFTRFFVSLFEIPHKALAVEIPKSYEDKASIMSLREGFQSLIALSHSFLILPLIGFQNDMSDWSAVGQVGAALMFVFGLISILGTLSLLPKLPSLTIKRRVWIFIAKQASEDFFVGLNLYTNCMGFSKQFDIFNTNTILGSNPTSNKKLYCYLFFNCCI